MSHAIGDCFALIPAAGHSARFSQSQRKQYAQIGEKTVIEHSAALFLSHPKIKKVCIVISKDDPYFDTLELAQHPKVCVATGGKERFDSVMNGLRVLQKFAMPNDWVLVHDGARPCLQIKDLNCLIETLQPLNHGGILATPVVDTLKESHNQHVVKTIDRRPLWQAKTPQMFKINALCEALSLCREKGIEVTDEASAMEHMGQTVQMVPCWHNLKITYTEDLHLARAMMEKPQKLRSLIPRVGMGFDVHRFGPETPQSQIVLCGYTIAHSKPIIAHSDGDVALHALCDGILGASGLGDIGQHFPDNDKHYKNADSREFLKKVLGLAKGVGLKINNVDLTIVAQKPKLAAHVPQMKLQLAQDLEVEPYQVNIKATTTEGLDAVGREEGISAYAMVSMEWI